MKKFTKVSLIVVAVIAGIGIVLLGISSLMGAGYGTIRRMARNGQLNYGGWRIGEDGVYYSLSDDEDILVEWDDLDALDEIIDLDDPDALDTYHGTDGTTENYLSYTYDVKNIKNLEVDIDAAELELTEGTNAEQIVVSLYQCREKYYNGKISGDTLEIEYDIEHYYNGRNNDKAKIVVEIPAGMSFGKLDLDIGATAADFDIPEVTCEKLNLDVGAGNVIVSGCTVTEKMDVSLGAGNAEINGGAYEDVELDCGMGEFSMEGRLNGDLKAECGMGNMILKFTGNETDYNYKISCGIGSIDVNGSRYSNISGDYSVKNPDAIGTIEMDCGMGSIDLTIESQNP